MKRTRDRYRLLVRPVTRSSTNGIQEISRQLREAVRGLVPGSVHLCRTTNWSDHQTRGHRCLPLSAAAAASALWTMASGAAESDHRWTRGSTAKLLGRDRRCRTHQPVVVKTRVKIAAPSAQQNMTSHAVPTNGAVVVLSGKDRAEAAGGPAAAARRRIRPQALRSSCQCRSRVRRSDGKFAELLSKAKSPTETFEEWNRKRGERSCRTGRRRRRRAGRTDETEDVEHQEMKKKRKSGCGEGLINRSPGR